MASSSFFCCPNMDTSKQSSNYSPCFLQKSPLLSAHQGLAPCQGLSTLCPTPRSAVPNYHRLGSLAHSRNVLSQFWRPNVQNQGVDKVSSFWRLLGVGRGGHLLHASLLASVVTQPSVCLAHSRVTPASASISCDPLPVSLSPDFFLLT